MAGAKQTRARNQSGTGRAAAKSSTAKSGAAKDRATKNRAAKSGAARGRAASGNSPERAGRPGTARLGTAAARRPGAPADARPAQAGFATPGTAPAGTALARTASARAVQTRRARDRAQARQLAQRSAVAEPRPAGPPFWLQLASLVLSVGGLGVSVYLTIAHYTSSSILACSDSGLVNCTAVTTSPESKVFGVLPVAVLGLAFFVCMVPMTTPWAWRSLRRELALARLAAVIVGVGFILYLIYVELIQVKAICLWCTSVHVMTFLLFVLVSFSAAIWGLPKAWGWSRAPSRS